LSLIENILIWLVIICAIVALIKLLLIPFVLAPMGAAAATIIQAINIIIWAVVAVFIIVVIFDLLSCLLGSGGGLRLR
jgi:hypothetical protein